MKETKEYKIYRLLPCYKNDVLAMEAWLEDMAAEGYMLKKLFLSIAIFVECEPTKVRFRLLPKPANKLLDMGGVPTVQENFIALRELEGWRHVASTSYYFIFYTKNAALPEPERDLYEIVSERYHEAKKSLVMEAATILCAIASLGMLNALTLSNIVWYGTLVFLLIFWLFFYAAGVSIYEMFRWKKIKNVLESEDINRYDWRDSAGFHKASTMMVYIVTTVLLIGASGTYLYSVHPSNTMAVEQYEDILPIPKVSEWYTDTNYVIPEEEANIANYNILEKRSDLLAPIILQIDEHGELYRDDTLLFAGGVDVEYYETIVPALAKPLAVSLYEADRAFGEKYSKYQPLELPEISADYVIAYQTFAQNKVVMAEDNKVIRVSYYQDDGIEEMTMDKLAQIYADYLLAEDSATK
ncbi:MAG: DUF2812 domain-containing protein [Peptococcaceae bacterium]|nr:DUF2812 domain-containing protein [Peptococcaceae bacterium]